MVCDPAFAFVFFVFVFSLSHLDLFGILFYGS